jgi:probable addiction module antidote protein
MRRMGERFFAVALEENDPEFLLSVIGDIARSRGMVQLARELNLDSKGLYKSLSTEGNLSFITVLQVLDKLGFKLLDCTGNRVWLNCRPEPRLNVVET